MKRNKLVAVLQRNGLVPIGRRGKGSHQLFRHPVFRDRFTTVPDRDVISDGLLKAILTQAGKSRDEYQERLREV